MPTYPFAPASAVPESVDSPEVRRAGTDVLSLALMDARNHTLHLVGILEQGLARAAHGEPKDPHLDPLPWLAGHVGWVAEYWIARNPQRALGQACPADAMRLASIEPNADRWWNPLLSAPGGRWRLDFPPLPSVRDYLLQTLEQTLELLDKAPPADADLYFYRVALCHEDWRGEQLVAMAQMLGVPVPVPLPGGMRVREPLLIPATTWSLGLPEGGFAWDIERPSHLQSVPEFEIDAQPVSWAQIVEFVDDGGYDRPELWHPEGWIWLQHNAAREGRRGPRYVDQIGMASGAVMQTRFGKPSRMAGNQAAMHLSWWEADAWCRWAGRRLPTELEWEVAAHAGARRGFVWGDVLEWTAGTLRPWPGYQAGPLAGMVEPWFGQARVQRGASFAARARMKHPRLRHFAMPGRDDGFYGFRSCAM
jgi:gamma-glutamyl hercynylcysteine S-oxide synthase